MKLPLFRPSILLLPFLLMLCCSCSRETAPLQWPEVRFCTSEKEAVKGELFYTEIMEEDVPDESVGIRGQLILNRLRGWYTAAPVPSFSYPGEYRFISEEDRKPSFYAYWTGDGRSLCYIHTRVFVSGFRQENPDPAKLSLYFRNPELRGNVILAFGSDTDNSSFFQAGYDRQPLQVSRVDIAEQEEGNIRHVLLIYAEFPENADKDKENSE